MVTRIVPEEVEAVDEAIPHAILVHRVHLETSLLNALTTRMRRATSTMYVMIPREQKHLMMTPDKDNQDIIKALKNVKLILKAGDPSCVIQWQAKLWEIQKVSDPLTMEEFTPYLAWLKRELLTAKNQPYLTDHVITDLSSKVWPQGKPAPTGVQNLCMRVMYWWNKFHATWVILEKGGFLEQAQKNLTLKANPTESHGR